MRSRTPHPHPTHPYVIRSCELSEMSNEEQDTTPHPTHSYVIRSCELSEMKQLGGGHLTPTLPTLCH